MIENPFFRAAEQKIESEILPDIWVDYLKIFVPGLSLALQGDGESRFAALQDSTAPLLDCAVLGLDLCLQARKQGGNAIPLTTTVRAARALMIHALHFVSTIGAAQVGNAELEQAHDIFNDIVFTRIMASNLVPLDTSVHSLANIESGARP